MDVEEEEFGQIDDESFQAIDQNLEESLDIETLRYLDEHISELFKRVFYSFSHDIDTSNVQSPGIVTHFVMRWKDAVGVSSIPKSIATVISGSIIEGSCLSRLFRPSYENYEELEADVMYVVGSINQETAKTCLQDVPDKPGFLKIIASNNIEIFLERIRLDELLEEDSHGKSFVNGSKLRIVHQHLQPGARGIHFVPSPCVVSVEEKITGPSSEILFEIHPLCDMDQLKKVETFFGDLSTKVSSIYETLKEELEAFEELELILDSVLKAVIYEETKRLANLLNQQLNIFEIEEIRNQVQPVFQEFVTGRQSIVEKIKDFREFLQAIDLLSRDHKDNHMRNKPFSDLGSVILQKLLSLGGMSKHQQNLNEYKESDVHGELSAMETAILESMMMVPNIHKFDKMLMTTVLNLTEASLKRSAGLKSDIYKSNSNNKKKTNFISFDNVSCFSCKFWPTVAAEWRLRNRKWPSSEHVEMIVKAGCFIVPKQSAADDDQHKLEWRWSFSVAEMKITVLRSPKMHYCYFVFKSLFYTYLKPKDKMRESLASYIVKTCMFHLSEQKEQSWWNTKQTSKCVYHLMTFLRKCLEAKTLSHYFIKELNLLSSVDDEVLKCSLEIVDMLLENPMKYFAFDSGPLGSINDIKEEIQQLDSSTNALSFAAGKESFGNRIVMCYEKRVKLVADNIRCKYLGQIYMLLEKKKMLETVIKMQEMSLPSTSTSAAGYVENFLENTNKPALKQVNDDLQKARDNVTKVLGGIRDLRKVWCIRCDGGCQQLIPCNVERWRCGDSACDYDICMECYIDERNTVDVVDGKHKHILQSTNQCSPYCYSQITEERLGSVNYSDAGLSITQNLVEIGWQLQGLATAYGTTDESAVFGNYGKIMSQELTNLYKSLGLKENHIEVSHDEINSTSSVGEEETRHQGEKKRETDDGKCDGDLAFFKQCLEDVQRKRFIFQSIYQ